MFNLVLSIPEEWRANLVVGFGLLVFELIIVYALIGLIVTRSQRKSEERMWSGARREFVAKHLHALSNLSYSARKLFNETDGKLHLDTRWELAATHFSQHAEDIDRLAAKYERAFPPDWVHRISGVNDDVRRANAFLQYAVDVMQGNSGLDSRESICDMKLGTPTEGEEETFVFPRREGDDHFNQLSQVSENTYDVCDYVSKAIDESFDFAEAEFSMDDLRRSESMRRLVSRKPEWPIEKLIDYARSSSREMKAHMAIIRTGEMYFVTSLPLIIEANS